MCVCVLLGMNARALHMLSKQSTIKIHLQSWLGSYFSLEFNYPSVYIVTWLMPVFANHFQVPQDADSPCFLEAACITERHPQHTVTEDISLHMDPQSQVLGCGAD